MRLLLLFGLAVCHAADVGTLYQQHCATCHGPKADNGLGGSLISGEWQFASEDPADQARVIREGLLPQQNMQGFGDVLSEAQIRGLVVYLQELQAQAQQQPVQRQAVVDTELHAYRVETMVEDDLEIPWACALLPDGGLLITERPGRLRRWHPDTGLAPEPVRDLPAITATGQGGLMEVALHPDHKDNGWVYLSLTDERDGRLLTAVARGRIRDGAWVDHAWIARFDERFYTRAGFHFGCRLVLHDGMLFFGIGDRGQKPLARELTHPNGKIFRLHDDGRTPVDNPFVDRQDALPGIWSLGHRNPQGLAMDREHHILYSTEHGPRGGDELNRIQPGHDYGWPLVTHGINYNGTPITEQTTAPGVTDPLRAWVPSPAFSGLAVYDGQAFPQWRGDLLAGALKAQELRRLRVHEDGEVQEEIILSERGRIRTVRVAADGSIVLVVNEPDAVIRMMPSTRQDRQVDTE
ncbi:MAG: PQQ-dependent sugar dehydrogenase [Planctomycetota bacterium]